MEHDKRKIIISLVLLFLGAGIYICKLFFDSRPNVIVASESIEEPRDTNEPEVIPVSFPVYLCGEVRCPGIYELDSPVYLYELIDMAGGLLPTAASSYVDMVYLVESAQSIYIPSQREIEEDQGGKSPFSDISIGHGSKGKASEEGLVNINLADSATLCTLPGIGEKTANAIIAYREEHGSFQKIEELKNVSGIGEGKYEKIKDLICV
ncbi:MAG: helix-hairpin-helix domain-containing protein [Clostridiales bacterium]|nr:helix-hairpin-helix domain-containing protein [Clostridiales bacterium]